MTRVLCEVCCGSAADVLQAHLGGADRVELNSDIFHGGLTPSIGTLLESRAIAPIPIMAMVRPRESGFNYSQTEYSVMRRDAEQLLAHGASGIVFGFLTPNGCVDTRRTAQLAKLALAAKCEAVYHRAIDVTPDPFAALEALIDCGITRVLTSGQQQRALQGAPLIARLIERAAGRIQVLPGAGITWENVAELIALTGCSQVHFCGFETYRDPSTANNPNIHFGNPSQPEDEYRLIDSARVQRVCAAANSQTHTR